MSGRNTFAGYQEAKQARRETIIDEYLEYLKTTRIRATHVTALADLVARHISTIEGKPCATSTLMRNLRYKTKLLTHQARQQSPGTHNLDEKSVKDPTAKALLASSNLEASNAVRELERLRIYASSLEAQLDTQGGSKAAPLSAPSLLAPRPGDIGVSDAEFRFIRTCQALMSVVAHLSIILELDPRGKRILDKSKHRNNVIATEETAGPFFEWLKSIPGAPR